MNEYEEALERARKVRDSIIASHNPESAKLYTGHIENIFPELAESEDERMMREFNDWFCEEIECRKNDLRDEEDRRILSMLCYVKYWFEKQKESLHISETCKDNADSFTDEDERIRKFLIDILSHGIWKKEWPFSPPECISWLEKQKEQKPAEWGEEDEVKLNDVIRIIENSGNVKSIIKHYTDFLKSLPERFNLQPKQEWSEEDESKLSTLLGMLKVMRELNSNDIIVGIYSKKEREKRFNEIETWLKSLRPQPKQEWSEEDELMAASIIDVLKQFEHQGATDMKIEWINNRLKSLRHFWKPSEEQIEALDAVYKTHSMSITNKATILKLLNDLKKLM